MMMGSFETAKRQLPPKRALPGRIKDTPIGLLFAISYEA
jgi:hypothetical protein